MKTRKFLTLLAVLALSFNLSATGCLPNDNNLLISETDKPSFQASKIESVETVIWPLPSIILLYPFSLLEELYKFI